MVTASERAARSLTVAFNRSRRAEGLTAWLAPNIQDWQTFVRNAWDERNLRLSRLVLNSLQEHSLWAGIVTAAAPEAARLAGARDRLAALAMEAHGLICAYAPQLLNKKARSAWDQDAAAFSDWLSRFDEICRANSLISAARLPLELIQALKQDSAERAPLLLAGFDRVLPAQQELFATWGDCTQVSLGETAAQIEFHQATDPASELAACAIWCKQQLAANPHARLLVVTQDVPARRGEIERAFLRLACEGGSASAASSVFEFSLGVPLSQIALARGASLLLHWLTEPIEEHELDWLLSTGQSLRRPTSRLHLPPSCAHCAAKICSAHAGCSRSSCARNPEPDCLPRGSLASRRLSAAFRNSRAVHNRQSPAAELVAELLELAGWPGVPPAYERRIPGPSPLAANRRRLRVARFQWPAHRVEGIPGSSRSRRE